MISDTQHEIPYYGKRRNVGAYEQPFSGVGMEFEPLGAAPADTGFVLHETGYWPNNYAWNFPKVYSPFWRIYYDFDKGHHVRFGTKRIALRPDRLLVIPNHQRFDCEGEAPVAKLWFAFSCNRNAYPAQPMPIVIPVNDTIAALVNEFPPLFRSRADDKPQRIYQLSLSFILYVLNHKKIQWQPPLPEALSALVAAINQHPNKPWTNARLAEQANLSTDALYRAFREWLHTTPGRYVQQVRVREGCRLLTDTAHSIDQIAHKLGFADRFHFGRIFKQHTNVSPARYRRMHGE